MSCIISLRGFVWPPELAHACHVRVPGGSLFFFLLFLTQKVVCCLVGLLFLFLFLTRKIVAVARVSSSLGE